MVLFNKLKKGNFKEATWLKVLKIRKLEITTRARCKLKVKKYFLFFGTKNNPRLKIKTALSKNRIIFIKGVL